MRMLFPLVVAAVLLPTGVAAQDIPPNPGTTRAIVRRLTEQQATAAAVQAVRGALQKGTLAHTWPVKSGGGAIPLASVTGAGALFNPTGGKNGTPVWVVGVTSPNGQGTVRVFVNATTGAVVPGGEAASFSWGAFQWGVAPAYWQQGLNSPPPARMR